MKRSWKILFSLLIALMASSGAESVDSRTLYEKNFTLEIFGNANMDEDVDEGDLIYLKGVLEGKNQATNLSDANYDGTIDEKDIDQIKKIISGESKQITIKDGENRIVTIEQPVKRSIALITGYTGFLYELDAGDTIVGAPQSGNYPTQRYYPQVEKLPNLGSISNLNCELVVQLHPDVVITRAGQLENAKPLVDQGIPVIALSISGLGLRTLSYNTKMLGAIMGKQEKAEALVAEMEATFSEILERTKDLPEEDKPLVFATSFSGTGDKLGSAYGENSWCTESIDLAGGINIYGNTVVDNQQLKPDLEYVVKTNPDVIFIMISAKDHQDFIETAKSHIKDMKNITGFSSINAVRDNRFCVIDNHYANFGPDHPENVIAMAKMLHPDRFTDLQFGEWVYVAGTEE